MYVDLSFDICWLNSQVCIYWMKWKMYFIFLNIEQNVPRMAVSFYIPTNKVWVTNFSEWYPEFGIVIIIIFLLLAVLITISYAVVIHLKTKGVKHLFLYLFTFHIPSVVNCLNVLTFPYCPVYSFYCWLLRVYLYLIQLTVECTVGENVASVHRQGYIETGMHLLKE